MESGEKVRLRPDSFADYYTQANLFYISQTPVEQKHIQAALTFELSKVKTQAIQKRVISHLLNIDTQLAKHVANLLGLKALPKPAPTFCIKKKNQAPSPSLIILLNNPNTFKGRKLAVIVSEKSNFSLVTYLEKLIKKEGGILEIIAPKILDFKNKKKFKPQQSFETAISVSYDAIVIITKPKDLLKYDPLKLFTFLQESFHQCKFIGYAHELVMIFKELKLKPDQGIVALKNASTCQKFIKLCRKLRYWERNKT